MAEVEPQLAPRDYIGMQRRFRKTRPYTYTGPLENRENTELRDCVFLFKKTREPLPTADLDDNTYNAIMALPT